MCETRKTSFSKLYPEKVTQNVSHLPLLQCLPLNPGAHRHRYRFSVNPDWQVPLLWQGEYFPQWFFKQKIRNRNTPTDISTTKKLFSRRTPRLFENVLSSQLRPKIVGVRPHKYSYIKDKVWRKLVFRNKEMSNTEKEGKKKWNRNKIGL